jgi:hypothetical protein
MGEMLKAMPSSALLAAIANVAARRKAGTAFWAINWADVRSVIHPSLHGGAIRRAVAPYELPDRYRSDPHGFRTMDGPLNENIQNDPMQSNMVRPFERSRKTILTRRANHRHIFIVTIRPAPENPLRAF